MHRSQAVLMHGTLVFMTFQSGASVLRDTVENS
jgi:hypothetical protein